VNTTRLELHETCQALAREQSQVNSYVREQQQAAAELAARDAQTAEMTAELRRQLDEAYEDIDRLTVASHANETTASDRSTSAVEVQQLNERLQQVISDKQDLVVRCDNLEASIVALEDMEAAFDLADVGFELSDFGGDFGGDAFRSFTSPTVKGLHGAAVQPSSLSEAKGIHSQSAAARKMAERHKSVKQLALFLRQQVAGAEEKVAYAQKRVAELESECEQCKATAEKDAVQAQQRVAELETECNQLLAAEEKASQRVTELETELCYINADLTDVDARKQLEAAKKT
jgi:uncharacterized coiled-coil DUF342 family protein